jgi:hypothetical protein
MGICPIAYNTFAERPQDIVYVHGDHTMGRRDMNLTMIMVKIQNEMIVRMQRLGVKNRSAVIRAALETHIPKMEAAKRRKNRAGGGK